MKKISVSQMNALLICCLFTRLMTYTPSDDDNALLLILSAALESLIQFILILPAAIFFKKYNLGTVGSVFQKSSKAGKITAAVYLLFCLYALITVFGRFTFFLQYSFSQYYSAWAVLLVLAAASVYTASMGLKACARASVIVAFITILGIILVLAGFQGNLDFRSLNLAVQDKGKILLDGTKRLLSRSDEFVFLVILLPLLKEKPIKTAGIFIGIKLLLTSIVTAAIAVILGEYAGSADLPFFALSSYSRTKIFERMDAFFLLFWTLCTVITTALILLCLNECMRLVLPNVHRIPFDITAAGICACISGIAIFLGVWRERLFESGAYIPVIILTGIIPLIILAFCKKEKKGREAS